MSHRLWIRVALGYLTVVALEIGVWALVYPQSFYDDFPGLGRSWVSVDGPYNEHLVRDVGALNLALAVLLIAALVRLTRPMVTTAALASMVWGVPHLIYHLANTDPLDAQDIVASIGGLLVAVALPIAIIWLSRKALSTPTDAPPVASPTSA